jgi:hypothetical protein
MDLPDADGLVQHPAVTADLANQVAQAQAEGWGWSGLNLLDEQAPKPRR